MNIVSPRAVFEHCSDTSSLDRLLASKRFLDKDGRRKKGEELAVAIWEYMVDKDEGVFHYCPPTEKLNGHYVWDAVKILNVFGWCICGTAANTFASIARHAGLLARIVLAKGHHVSEVFYNGSWHLMDVDLQAFHRRHPPDQGIIASYEDLIADSTLIDRQRNPSDPYYLPDRTPEKMNYLYEVQPRTLPAYVESVHRMDFVLRPGESLERFTRGFGHWIWLDGFSEFKRNYPEEWMESGPGERHYRRRTYCNGRWTYEPDLTDKSLDFEAGVFESDNMLCMPDGLAAGDTSKAASCIFEFNSPWLFAGSPARDGAEEPRDGVLVEFSVSIGGEGSVELLLSSDGGKEFSSVWRCSDEGRHNVRTDITAKVVNSNRFLIKFEFGPGKATLLRFKTTASIMLSRISLGEMKSGENKVRLGFNDNDGHQNSGFVTEMDFSRIKSVDSLPCESSNLAIEPGDPDFTLPADGRNPYSMIFRMQAPDRRRLSEIFVHVGYRGKSQFDKHEHRIRAEWAELPDGPWHRIFDSEVLPHPERWHISAQGRSTIPSLGSAFVRIMARTGIKTVKLRTSCVDERSSLSPKPLLRVIHEWEENGKTRTHEERVENPDQPREYSISAGENPRLEKILFHAGHLAGRKS